MSARPVDFSVRNTEPLPVPAWFWTRRALEARIIGQKNGNVWVRTQLLSATTVRPLRTRLRIIIFVRSVSMLPGPILGKFFQFNGFEDGIRTELRILSSVSCIHLVVGCSQKAGSWSSKIYFYELIFLNFYFTDSHYICWKQPAYRGDHINQILQIARWIQLEIKEIIKKEVRVPAASFFERPVVFLKFCGRIRN